ncbi:hypothetical protein SAMN05216249_10713 [Acetitomaculum ruminis DSM 5522]|uniref:Uncharacterized protein n=1 Tax=Acetitomaculum ruminis DSM 5522 TaxID=1120918 RepID=A0A1I0XLX4_9FIRM|nr:DUF5688 family protein [Acetitomaculum ruminis]SFB01972.1 hypothetical protein SAMN05216249_10713 [Acetitomaculum ruminis DSM 5522]
MKYNEFLVCIKRKLEEMLGKDYEVIIAKIRKNNGKVFEGVTINKKGLNISPTIYLNTYFDEYSMGKRIDVIAREIYEIYERNSISHNMNMAYFSEYENVKEKIVYKLVNFEKNIDFLKDVPYIKFLDMAIIFCYYINNIPEFDRASITIKNDHLKLWDKTTTNLFEDAKINTPRLLDVKINNLESILGHNFASKDEGSFDSVLHASANDDCQMYLLSNSTYVNGAITILYPNVLSKISDILGKDFYIIPSSIHEGATRFAI